MDSNLESARLAVLNAYGAVASGMRWFPLDGGGGFSGASVWRGETEAGQALFALKAWPRDGMTAARLARIHDWMRDAGTLPFVPTVIPNRVNATVTESGGRVWDLERWMPGIADFHRHPGPRRLASACTAIAQVHQRWAPRSRMSRNCPGVERRLKILDEWDGVGLRLEAARATMQPSLFEVLSRGAELAFRFAAPARRRLAHWSNRQVAIQPCLCDIWHDHVLFTGESVTGIIDYGAMKEDHVAVDLARLLGDLVGDEDAAFAAGLQAYRDAGGRLDGPDEFVRLLDRTGVVCGIIVWIRRALLGTAVGIDPERIIGRLNRLVFRLGTASISDTSDLM